MDQQEEQNKKKFNTIQVIKTGPDKTSAFELPTFQQLLANLRELCIEIQEDFHVIGASRVLKAVIIFGGRDPLAQAKTYAQKPHIIVCTLEQGLNHLESTKGVKTKKLKFLVLDEAFFEREINSILDIIPKGTKQNYRQPCSKVKINFQSKYQTISTIQQYYLQNLKNTKKPIWQEILRLYFQQHFNWRSRQHCYLEIFDFNQKIIIINKFKSQKSNLLIAIDVASRGLYIPFINMLINFDIKLNTNQYVHKEGRTARAGKYGKAMSLGTQYDVQMYQKVELKDLLEKRLRGLELMKMIWMIKK
ncbi:unnamed protein product [Paramecium pentaurelia]|uniref:Helicase C-terminal domain-containing protein n=1 Tax=Paramecium pentaurelia TaxID=43138 RepID=A0A8S1VHT6_9CILI|nr:unnamed protein product [Paramecium pentaurelia]